MSKANQMGRDIMSMSDGEVLDLVYDKLKKTLEDCSFQSVYLNTPNFKGESSGMKGQVEGRREIAEELLKILEDNQETEYVWFATDGQGNNMGTFVLESSARDFAMKYGYTVGWWIKDKE